MKRFIGALVAAFIAVASAYGQTSLTLKTGTVRRSSPAPGAQKNLDASRWHEVVQFATAPDATTVQMLSALGIRVLGYIPNSGLFVSVSDNTSLANIGAIWSGPLDPSLKISPLLNGRGNENPAYDFVVEFFSDVPAGDASSIVLQSGLTLEDNPSLLPNHLLIHGSRRLLGQLAEWDEVEYIFPASDDLAQGLTSGGCAGAYTSAGVVTQSIPLIGDGWDGPGLGSASLTYSFTQLAPALPAASVQAEIVRALNEWSKYVQVTFSPSAGDPNQNIAVMFASGAHGDGYPFTSSSTLAHTFYPYPVNPEPIAGNMHFNDDESWEIGADTDVFSVALHEAGHALGLGHSDNPNAVMYPYYKRVSGLSQDDIDAIRLLYAAATPGTSTTNNSGPPPADGPGSSNPPTPAPGSGTPSTGNAPTSGAGNAAPSMTIVSPASTNVGTSASTITVSGTATSGASLASVVWTNSSVWSGTATGLAQWTIPGIPLMVGANTIIITVTDTLGNTAWRSLVVTRVAD